MEEIKAPKKERKFLKAIGKIGKSLAEELVMGIGRKFIGNVVNKIKFQKKNNTLSFLLLLSCTFAFAQYPATGNKQRLGYQTTGDGLVFRGRASDTVSLKSSTINNAYIIIDTLTNVMYNYIKTKGGWNFNNSDTVIIQGATMPFDSITFNTAKDGTVGVGEVEYNDSQGSLIQGLKGGNVTNVIGQQLHQRVSNVTGSTLSKGTAVYLSGSQGNRITAAKALATSDPTSANTFGIVAESIADNASGYVITEGLITGINTSGLTEDSAVYLSPTVAGRLTSIKPQAPNHGVYIGVCVKSNAGSGELFVKIKNGLELDELHDVLITSPASNASLYYKSSEGIWRDTTAALLVSDTSSMLTNYLRTGVAASTYQTKLTNPITGTGTTNYLPKFTGTTTLGNSTIFDNGNVGIGNNNPTISLDILNSTSSTSAKIRLETQFQSAIRTLTIGSGDGIIWDLPGETSQSPYIKVSGGSTNYGGGSFHIKTNGDNDRLSINQDGNVGINDNTPSYKLDVNGTTGLQGALTVNNATVLNEGSGDYDTRIESDGNANMVFVDASTDRVGIGTSSPSKTLDVNGQIGSTGFIKSGGTSSQFLKADGSVDANTYLTTGTAASTYLPLTGGTVSGTINIADQFNDGSPLTAYYNILNYYARRDNVKGNQTAQITFTDRPGTATFENNVRTSDIYLMTARNFNGSQLGQYLDTTFSVVANQDGGRIGISKLNPAYKLDVNGTLGVTGATTLSNLSGSGTRMVTANSTGVLSTQAIPTGTLVGTDTVSLSNRINGKVGLTGNDIISGTKTFNSLVNLASNLILSGSYSQTNKLLGKNSSDGVGNITVGSGLNLTSDVLTATQIDTTSLSNRINAKVGLTGNETIAGNKSFSNKIILNDSSRFEGNVLFKKNMGLPIVKISNADYTATTANHTIIYTTLTSDKTLTIPNAADAVGIKYTISIFDEPEGNEALTLITPSSNLFVRTDGENSSVDIVGGFCTVIQSDGIKWYILSYSPMY
jgi:hypothetical protein